MTAVLLAAAGAHPRHPWLALALVLTVTGAGYWLACQVWPYAACRTCHGDGRRRSPGRAAWRGCRTCNGTGTRRRLLARTRHR
jgi:hypothetical protein